MNPMSAAIPSRRPAESRVTASADYPAWRRVSLAMQELLRRRVPDLYFRDHPGRLADRLQACSVIVYGASRVYYPTGPAELSRPAVITDPAAFNRAFSQIVGRTKASLAPTPDILRRLGRYELAARYNPHFAEDIIRSVRAHPRPIRSIFFSEARLMNALMALEAARFSDRRFALESRRALQILHVDMSALLPEVLAAAQVILSPDIERLEKCN